MHEYSIVQSLLDQCEDNAKQNDATRVLKVIVKIGALCGVEIELLKTAFNTFKENTVCNDAEFIVNYQKVVIECQVCGEISTLDKNEFLCPSCQGNSVTVKDGEDMYLMSLEME